MTDEIKTINSTPCNFLGKKYIPDGNDSFFCKMISEINFYNLININANDSLLQEIKGKISNKKCQFAVFTFTEFQDNRYLTIIFEKNCFLFLIHQSSTNIIDNINIISYKSYFTTLLSCFFNRKIIFISPKNEDYEDFQKLINECIITNSGNTNTANSNLKLSKKCFHYINKSVFSLVENSKDKETLLQFPVFNITYIPIISYFIGRIYFKSKYFEFPSFFDTKIKGRRFDQKEFIELLTMETNTKLVFHHQTIQFFVQKKQKNDNDEKYMNREISAYKKTNKLDKFVKCIGYTKTANKRTESLILQYMSKGTLKNKIIYMINKEKLHIEKKEKYNKVRIVMIIQIVDQLFTLHYNNIIYRDLKPNNIFIDHDSNIHIGDFDLAVNYSNEITSEMTSSIGSPFFSAPESSSHNIYTFESDIFSLGRIIYFIYTGEIRETKNYLNIFGNEKIRNLYIQCVRNDPDSRPAETLILKQIIDILNEVGFCRDEILSLFSKINLNLLYNIGLSFYECKDIIKAIDLLQISADKNHSHSQALLGYIYSINTLSVFNKNKALYYLGNAAAKGNSIAQYKLGRLYSDGLIVERDIKKAIYYYELASNQNDSDAQYSLGKIYYEDKNERDIFKSIHYLVLSSNQNNSGAQHLLGVIYYFDDYLRDVNKSIICLKLSSIQNNAFSQILLGFIYYEGKYIQRDMNAAIHYFSLAAEQKDAFAYYYLGIIFLDKKYPQMDIYKGLYYLKLSANQNNPIVLYYISQIYFDGILIPKDIRQCIYYLELSANQNFVHAQTMLGHIYSYGIYAKKDIKKAMHYYELASNQNDSDAQYSLGRIYYEDKSERDILKSVHYLILSSNQNNSGAQHLLGVIYYLNDYLRDVNKSIIYLKLSSNQNNVLSQILLGFIYYEGKYIQRDINAAIHYFSLAAEQKNALAYYFLGEIFLDKKYSQMDIEKGLHYLKLSAEQNHPGAQSKLGLIYYEGTIIPLDVNKGLHYLSSANQNHPNAQYNIAKIYYDGIHVPKDISRAIYYLELSANQNISQAQTMLGCIYLYSEFDNKEKGLYYLTLASNQKDADAQFSLGYLYSDGTIVKEDIKKAINYYELASNQNHSIAQYNLGYLYFEGVKVKRDLNKAIFYLTLSAKQNNTNAQYLLGLIYYIHDELINKNNCNENDDDLKPLDANKSLINFVSSAENYFHGSTFAMGAIYYEGIYIKQDYKKAIHYFKESSSFNNLMAKNNLGIMYKNGYGVEKNINNAVIYLKEGSDNGDYYSSYNYARILYFGIDQFQQNIPESIELLEKTIKHDFLLSYFFLYFIYFKGDKKFRNKEKTQYYRSMILKSKYGKSPVVDIILKAKKFKYDPFFFLKEYDILYLFSKENFNKYYCEYLAYGTYPSKQKKEKTNTCKNIDKNFYDGFELD